MLEVTIVNLAKTVVELLLEMYPLNKDSRTGLKHTASQSENIQYYTAVYTVLISHLTKRSLSLSASLFSLFVI